MRYRRADVTGGTYFFTVNLAERKRILLVDHVDVLRNVLREVKASHPFHIDAMLILPDHLHALWTLPPGDTDYSRRWAIIKQTMSKLCYIHAAHPGGLSNQTNNSLSEPI